MRNDKEFKVKNRDESYVKDKRPDIRLGRHKDMDGQKPQLTQSKKNRIYRARQADIVTADKGENVSAETKVDTNSVPAENADDKDTELHQQTETESISQDIPKKEPSYSPDANKKKYRRKMYRMQKQAKSADYNFAEQTGNPTDYDISEKVQESKMEFLKNTDMNFSESVSDRDSNMPFDSVGDIKSNTDKKTQPKKRQKLSFKKSDSGDIPFDRVIKFEKKANTIEN